MSTYPLFHPLPKPRKSQPLILTHPCQPQAPLPPPRAPTISCSAVPRDGRSASSRTPVTLTLESQSANHILSAPLGPSFSSDSITIALKRNYVLVIIADCWSSETECQSIFRPTHSLPPPFTCDPACSSDTHSHPPPDPSSFVPLLRLKDGSTLQQRLIARTDVPHALTHQLVSINPPTQPSSSLKYPILTPR